MSRTEIIRMPTQVVQMTTQQMVIQKAMQDTMLANQQIIQGMQNAMAFHDATLPYIPQIAKATADGRGVTVTGEWIMEWET